MTRYDARVHVGEVEVADELPLGVERGWSASIAEQLPLLSRQPHILEHTPNDADRRFRDKQAAEAWYADPRKNSRVYTLGRGTTAIAGLAWVSDQSHPAVAEAAHTFAIRLYDGYRGRGLALPFARIVHDDFLAGSPDGPIWLETDTDNLAAQKIYHRLGYTALPQARADRLVMVNTGSTLI